MSTEFLYMAERLTGIKAILWLGGSELPNDLTSACPRNKQKEF